MDESTQQLIALLVVGVAVCLELFRRYRRKQAGKAGCDGCESPSGGKPNTKGEAPVRFYKKS